MTAISEGRDAGRRSSRRDNGSEVGRTAGRHSTVCLIPAVATEAGRRTSTVSGGGYFGSDFYLDLAAKFGAVMTLEKPFLLSELVRTVNAILGEAVGNCGPEGQDPEDPAGPPEQQVGFGTEKVVDIKTRRNLRSATKERRELEKKAAASMLTIPPFLEPSFR